MCSCRAIGRNDHARFRNASETTVLHCALFQTPDRPRRACQNLWEPWKLHRNIFLGAGIYLLREAFADPLTAQSVGVISGAVVIALATMLIYFLVSPRAQSRSCKARRHSDAGAVVRTLSVPAPAAPAQEDATKDLVMQV